MISKHLPEGTLPIPFNAIDKKYDSFYETYSEQRGLLMAIDPQFVQENSYGYTRRIEELFDIPKYTKKSHDHNPANDAYTIACEQQVLLGIMNGTIKRVDPIVPQ